MSVMKTRVVTRVGELTARDHRMDESLFDAFDETAPPAPPNALPSAFSHLESEAVASVNFRCIPDDCRQQIEDVLRKATVAPREEVNAKAGGADCCTGGALAAAGVVHYFQAFAADYAGAASVEAAINGPTPQYERLPSAPFPWPASDASLGNRGGGGRGRARPPPPRRARGVPGVLALAS